ncbi:uncharacterized protein LOC119682324 isoform X2 [Teleopsis dalmanni]|uniref:uncharacterized protein LOC119682324 isoform X2 n=1 Tax=Teleopsis dalmanni TaxID=139649 RepID=UPI0018CD960C|nr:uncharacterized protein LOC119682324 isoform X2 [Teleopsis dalmanni]
MNSNENFILAWEELYFSIYEYINKKSDIIVALIHCFLVSEMNFRCIGNGEDKILMDDEIGSEDLPDGWNENDNRYALRYVYGNRLYILFGHVVNDCVLLNILNVSTGKVSNILLNPENLVNDDIPTILERSRQELIEPVVTQLKVDATTQTDNIFNRRQNAIMNRNTNSQQVIRHVASEMPISAAHNASNLTLRSNSNGHHFNLPSRAMYLPFHPIHIHERERRLRFLHPIDAQPSNRNALVPIMDIVRPEPSSANSSNSNPNYEQRNNNQINISDNIDNTDNFPQTSQINGDSRDRTRVSETTERGTNTHSSTIEEIPTDINNDNGNR